MSWLAWRMFFWKCTESIYEGLYGPLRYEISCLPRNIRNISQRDKQPRVLYWRYNILFQQAGVISKYAMGCQHPSRNCCRSAPMAVSEASVMIEVGPSGAGWVKRVTSAKAALAALKAERASSVHVTVLALSLGWNNSWLRGALERHNVGWSIDKSSQDR